VSSSYESIMETSLKLFSRQGYSATSIRQIADELGIAKATIYHHFKDKQAILVALIGGVAEKEQSALDEIRKELTPYNRLKKVVEVDLKLFRDSAGIIQTVRQEITDERTKFRDGYIGFIKEQMTLIEESLADGIRQNIFRELNPHDAAYSLMAMIQGVVTMAMLTNKSQKIGKETSAQILDLFIRGIEKHKE